MRWFVWVTLLHFESAAELHSLKYFSMGLSGPSNLPEFVSVGELDGVEMFHYDNNAWRAQPTQDWIYRLKADDPYHWKWQIRNLMHQQGNFKVNIESLRQHFNQSGGVHILQKIHGCEWDSETGDVHGFMKSAYDGEDFITFNPMTKTWVPRKKEALIIKHLWDDDTAGNIWLHYFLSRECPERLKKYLKYGNSSLLRTEVPRVFLLQRSPGSTISCLATGFSPNGAKLFWRKDGEELKEGVDIGDTLPNHDGTFQMRARLNLSSDEDWHRYKCVFQLSGIKEELVTALDKAAVSRNSDGLDKRPMVLSVVSAVFAMAFII